MSTIMPRQVAKRISPGHPSILKEREQVGNCAVKLYHYLCQALNLTPDVTNPNA
jgi:hypothetical protein